MRNRIYCAALAKWHETGGEERRESGGGKTLAVDWDLQVGEAGSLAGVEAGVRLMSVVPCLELMAK